jgi:hypothetical protein
MFLFEVFLKFLPLLGQFPQSFFNYGNFTMNFRPWSKNAASC